MFSVYIIPMDAGGLLFGIIDACYIGWVSTRDQVRRIIGRILSDGIRQFTRWIPVAIEHVCNRMTSFCARQTSPKHLQWLWDWCRSERELREVLTAVMFGCSIQGSRIKGPTLCTITIVLLFCAATAKTRLSPPCQAVKFFLWAEVSCEYLKPQECRKPQTDLLHCHLWWYNPRQNPNWWTREQQTREWRCCPLMEDQNRPTTKISMSCPSVHVLE